MRPLTPLAWLLPVFFSAAVLAVHPSADELRTQAEAGDAWAQLNLGAYYDHGTDGLPLCPSRAFYWYQRAAEQGLAYAQFNLGHSYATGNGVAQDYGQARMWLQRAAAQGEAEAAFLVGVIYRDGLGLAADPVWARRWFRRATLLGYVEGGQ